jgi:Domain of unknown function (DUF6504)
MEENTQHFIGEEVEVHFDHPPVRRKTPNCPDSFTWREQTYRIIEKLSEWSDFSRRGKMARNMQPAHAAVAASCGSLGVGRFFFRVRANSGQVFDIYYDREIRDVDDRLGHWFVYREINES